MHPRQRHRLITVIFLLFSLLFMQLAVASYGCPVDGKAVAVMQSAVPCAEAMAVDTEQVALCHAHCQSDQQSAEKAQTHQPIGADGTGVTYPIKPAKVDRMVSQGYMPSESRITAPPMTIRNCCFRI